MPAYDRDIENPAGLRICTTCGVEKLLSEFHFQRHIVPTTQKPSEGQRGRYRSNCKVCQREYMRNRRVKKIIEQGSSYLEEETKRVRKYYDAEERLDVRRAIDRARYTANTQLRERHPVEYEELFQQARLHEGVPGDFSS